jgi:hypothetical protein
VYFPVLGQGLGGIATDLGNLREQLVQFLLQPQVVAAIQAWMTAFAGLGAPIGQMITNLMPTLITLFTDFATIMTNTVVPVVTTLAGWLADAVSFVTPLLTGVSNIISGVGSSGSGSSGGSSGGGLGGIFSGIVSGITGFFSSIFGGGRATGGPVSAGRFYRVGESGPEILGMGQNGFIHPNSGGSNPGHTFVNVKIGETELRGMISTEINNSNQAVAVASRMGRGTIV